MDVSVIIVNYHSADLVVDCIHSIYEKTENILYEIIVVDNASCDGSVERLQKEFGNKITVIASEENLGFGKANNLGATVAQGRYLFLLNPDTLLVTNAINQLYHYLDEHPNVGVAGGNLYTPDMKAAPSYCMVFDSIEIEKKKASWVELIGGKIKTKAEQRFKKEKRLSFEQEFNHGDKPKEVAYIFGADMMMPKSLFNQVGGFDPDFFMYGEEEELTCRIADAGYKSMNVPDVKIIHLEGATVKAQGAFSERQFKMRMTGTMTYYNKRFGMDGVRQFYKYRSLRYQRLIRIATIQGKDTENFGPMIQKCCLDEVYQQFLDK